MPVPVPSSETFRLFDEPPRSIMTLTDEQRQHIYSFLPPDARVVAMAAAQCRICDKQKGVGEWESVSPDRGLVVLGSSTVVQNGKRHWVSWIRFLDLSRSVPELWAHTVHTAFKYQYQTPTHHFFENSKRNKTYFLMFYHTEDASNLYEEFNLIISGNRCKSPPCLPTQISKNMISGPMPETFVHVGQLAYDDEGFPMSSGRISEESMSTLDSIETAAQQANRSRFSTIRDGFSLKQGDADHSHAASPSFPPPVVEHIIRSSSAGVSRKLNWFKPVDRA